MSELKDLITTLPELCDELEQLREIRQQAINLAETVTECFPCPVCKPAAEAFLIHAEAIGQKWTPETARLQKGGTFGT